MNNSIQIKICMDTGGIAAGSVDVMNAFQDELDRLGLEAEVKSRCLVKQVGCRGLCARDILVGIVIDGVETTYQYIDPGKVRRLIEQHIVKGELVREWLAEEEYSSFLSLQKKNVLAHNGIIDPEDINDYLAIDGYKGIAGVLAGMSPDELIDLIRGSGLRGRGGAGFPTGLKWQICRAQTPSTRYLICNADEGDPGAFMDRSLIEGNPHMLIEGMIIAAYAIGANQAFVYIRAEYPLAVKRLEKALADAYERGFLGQGIHDSPFGLDIKVRLGAGAFVCGEETALIASIEGERGMPRAKPPYPAQKGLWGQPTVINNVETLANLPNILKFGAEWFASTGSENSKGTKVISLTGKIRNTGLIEIPMGLPLKDILFKIGGGIAEGRLFKAVQTGGPSGGCIPQQHIDLPVDYENLKKVGSIMGSGGMVVLDEQDCMVNMARYFLEFTQSESCGKCTPCRIGTKRLLEILERITNGEGREGDIELLTDLAEDIRDTSLCGLGMSAPNPVLSTIRYFRHEYEAHIHDKRCPAKVCRKLLTFFIRDDLCTGCGLCLKNCPSEAISGEKGATHRIDTAACIKCGTCYEVCKFKAVLRE